MHTLPNLIVRRNEVSGSNTPMPCADSYLTQINPEPFLRSPGGTFKQPISFKMRLKILPCWCLMINKLLVAPVLLTLGCSGIPASWVRVWERHCANEGITSLIRRTPPSPHYPPEPSQASPSPCSHPGKRVTWRDAVALALGPSCPPQLPWTKVKAEREQKVFYGVKRPSLK